MRLHLFNVAARLAAASVFFIAATASAETVANPHVCGLPNGRGLTTFQDSLDEAADHSLVLATALNDMVSFPDIQHFVAEARPQKVCVTAIAVSKNIYQYDEFLTVLTMTMNDQSELALPLIFQASSIQAHDNTGPKPWLGFPKTSFVNAVKNAIAKMTFTDEPNRDVDAFSPMSVLSHVLKLPTIEQPLDSGSQSYLLVPGADPEWTTYLVSQLRSLQTGNPFTTQVLLDAGVVQIQTTSGRVRTGPLPSFFSELTHFEELQERSRPAQSTDAAHVATLMKMSR